MLASCMAPPRKCKLSIIDSVHNSGKRLANGGFCTCRIESLYVVSGEPSLCLRRNFLLCSYATKMAKHRPSYVAIVHPAHSNRYELHDASPRPVGVRFFSASVYTCRILFPLHPRLSDPVKSYEQPAIFGSSNTR
jgi:hypothetical protein